MQKQDLFNQVEKFISEGYGEQARYCYIMPELLKSGLHQFTADLAMTRQWADRMLSILERARQFRPLVEEAVKAATRQLDYSIVRLLSDPGVNVPKRLDAGQRYCWAKAQFGDLEQERDDWERLHHELKAFIQTADDRFKHLLSAKNDLRSQLWAVRLHGLLGDLHQEGQSLEDELRPPYRQVQNDSGSQTDITIPIPTLPKRQQTPLNELLANPKKE